MSPEEFDASVDADTEAARNAVGTTARSLSLDDAVTAILEGNPGAAICDYATEVSARAIVIGSRGRAVQRRCDVTVPSET